MRRGDYPALTFQSRSHRSSRLALAFYCIGSLDLLGVLCEGTTETDRESWREWIWEQQTSSCDLLSGYCRRSHQYGKIEGRYGSGFRPSPYATAQHPPEIQVRSDTL